jgi:hypothetical protein
MQYAIVSAPNPSELERLVNERLAKGWELYGSFQIGKNYYQAMTYKPS